MFDNLLTAAYELQPETVAFRRSLHERPEIGNHLPQTREQVLAAIEDLPLDVTLHERTSGIVGVLMGDRPGPAIILRGDMDALPMQEDTDLDFASAHDTTMHACGHDLHTAMLAGAARILTNRANSLAGSVVFMFQPGEEGHHGARFMLDEGLLDRDPRPTGAFALHVTTIFESGTINHRGGPQLASADEVEITVTGKGGHASAPHHAFDPIPVAAEIILAVQTAVTRRFSVFEPVVVTFGRVTSGTTHNVIPETATLVGTVRSLSDESRTAVHEMLERVSTNIAAAHGLQAKLHIRRGYPVTVNDRQFADFVRSIASDLIGHEGVRPMRDPLMGAEDWSYVLEQVPGAMAFLGACPPHLEPGVAPNNHSNRVVFDEDAMPVGIALYAAVASAFLTEEQ
ncbi:MAG: M20 family metallopeptidase [Acidimicrobiia bacterium]|nr:M20 family metallopeptidase [Acidimicrobiia bacterium]